MPTPIPTRSDLPRMIEQLERVGDELRLQLHLAGMDARKEWSSLEREIFQVRERIAPHRERTNHTRLKQAVAMGRAVRRFVVAHLKSPLGRRPPKLTKLPYGFVAQLRGTSMKTALNRITRELTSEGFSVTSEADARGASKTKLGHRMLNAYPLDLAAKALERDSHSDLLVTCYVVARETGSGVAVSALSPTMMLGSSEADMTDIAEDVEKRLIHALEAVARG